MLDPYTGDVADKLFTAVDNRGLSGEFTYYRGTAGHIFQWPVPDDLGRHYEAGYQRIPETVSDLEEMAKGDAYRLDLIKKLKTHGKFLEIGPWIGLVAYSAKVAGFQVSALEMSPECVDLMKRAGINARQTDDPAVTLKAENQQYDVVGLWHSIEHMPKPWELIEAAANAVAPGGVLVIAAPNPLSAQMRVLRDKWLHLDAPRHLHLLPASAYEEIGKQAGLETVECTTNDHLGVILDRDGWAYEAHRRVGNLPILRTISRYLLRDRLAAKHRQPGEFDGAGFTLTMMRP